LDWWVTRRVKEYVPAGVVEEVLILNNEYCSLPSDEVTDAGLKVAVAPVGSPAETLKAPVQVPLVVLKVTPTE
jgi:hypothetical protein